MACKLFVFIHLVRVACWYNPSLTISSILCHVVTPEIDSKWFSIKYNKQFVHALRHRITSNHWNGPDWPFLRVWIAFGECGKHIRDIGSPNWHLNFEFDGGLWMEFISILIACDAWIDPVHSFRNQIIRTNYSIRNNEHFSSQAALP